MFSQIALISKLQKALLCNLHIKTAFKEHQVGDIVSVVAVTIITHAPPPLNNQFTLADLGSFVLTKMKSAESGISLSPINHLKYLLYLLVTTSAP